MGLGWGGGEVIVVSGARVSIVHVVLAGEASTFPAASVAFTWKVWLPSASPVYDCGLTHETNAAPSREHSKVLLPSVEVKLNEGFGLLLGFDGEAVIVVSGGVVSGMVIVHEKLAGVASLLPAASAAFTWKVWLPLPSPV